ncbi:MAG: hypothetical protein V1870_01840 [Candidatus Aenigmatarchaeota archaeon]
MYYKEGTIDILLYESSAEYPLELIVKTPEFIKWYHLVMKFVESGPAEISEVAQV